MSVVKLRIEIERALRGFVAGRVDVSSRPLSIGSVLRDLKQRGIAPPSTDRFLEALRVMNEAAHGFDVDPAAAERAVNVGTEFLAELSAIDLGPYIPDTPRTIAAMRSFLSSGTDSRTIRSMLAAEPYPVIEAFGQQRGLTPVGSLNEALHRSPPQNARRPIADSLFSRSQGQKTDFMGRCFLWLLRPRKKT